MSIIERNIFQNDPDSTEFEMIDGQLFDPLAPDPRRISLDVIATVLSNSCRFGGHVSKFYSTAQHSVLVAFLAPRDIDAQKYALLHDSDEAFGLPDMLTMLKKRFLSFKQAQDRISRAVEIKFSLNPDDHARIKPADRQALMIERLAVKPRGNPSFWNMWSGGLACPEGIRVNPLQPEAARDLYVDALIRVFRENEPIDTPWLMRREGFRIDPELLSGIGWMGHVEKTRSTRLIEEAEPAF